MKPLARRDEVTLIQIIEACRRILLFKEDISQETLHSDLKTQSAILHQLLVIGEATKRLSDHFCEQHTSIPWSKIAGMRDRLIHGYDLVDLDEVWNTITRDIPTLQAFIEPRLPPKS